MSDQIDQPNPAAPNGPPSPAAETGRANAADLLPPTPWRIQEAWGERRVLVYHEILDANGTIISSTWSKPNLPLARLLATAPDLLAMLKTARECIAYCRRAHPDAQSGEGFPVEMLIDKAIAKAEGRS